MANFDAILAGAGPGEAQEDIKHMCRFMAYALYRRRFPASGTEDLELYDTCLVDAGKILCLIFDMVKPEPYQIEMRKARAGYRGIADDSHLQDLYAERVRSALAAGELDSIDAAVSSNLPARLALPEEEHVTA